MSRRVRAGCIALLLLANSLFLVLGVRRYRETRDTRAYDLILDWNGARVLRQGVNPFSPEGLKMVGATPELGFGHPPTTYLWLLPLADRTLPEAKRAWNAFTVALVYAQSAMAVFELALPFPWLTAPLVGSALLSSSFMREHLYVGQLATLISFWYVLAWLLLRRRRDLAAGVALGLAATLKFYPGLPIVLLALCRRWRCTAGAALGWGVPAAGVTAVIGWRAWLQFLEQARPYTVAWLPHLRNASLHGIVQRIHYPICEYGAAIRPLWEAGTYYASAATLALTAALWWQTRRDARPGGAIDVPFAMFVCASLLGSPYYWEHYNVTLMLPLVIAATAVVRARAVGLPRVGWIAGGASVAAIVWMLAIDVRLKNRLWERYYGPHPPSHLKLHLFEVLSWAPAPACLALLALLLGWAHRQDPLAFRRFFFWKNGTNRA
jgi:hypothetical protein